MAADRQSILPVSNISNDQTVALDTELSSSSKKQKILPEKNSTHYCDFSTTTTTETNSSDSKQLNPVEEILQQATTFTDDQDSDEDEQKKKVAAAKKLLFPGALATSFPEVVDTLRNERRQEFCPIYQDETPEAIAQRQAGRKPIGSLLAKRIRWDDLKRKREENQRQPQVHLRYGPYGPVYADPQQTYPKRYGQNRTNMPVQSQQSFANPYEQYYTAAQHQYEQVWFQFDVVLDVFFSFVSSRRHR